MKTKKNDRNFTKKLKSFILSIVLIFNVITIIPNGTLIVLASDGSESNPFIVSTPAELAKVGTGIDGWSLNKHYILANNIIAPSNLIIGDYDNPFNGTFNGNGYTVTVNINQPTRLDVGLFGVISTSGVVKNLSISGNVAGLGFVGSIAGENGDSDIKGGRIENCSSSATIHTIGTVTSSGNAGGLVGGNSGIIIACNNTGNVNSFYTVGGIAGENLGIIRDCWSSGTITGSTALGGVSIGGIVGSNYGESIVENCYTVGSMSGHNLVGGIIGDNDNGAIKNCVSMVTSLNSVNIVQPEIGRIVGRLYSGTLKNNFALNNIRVNNLIITSDTSNDIHGADLNPSNVTEAFFRSLGWDFNSVWTINPNVNNGFPYLKSNVSDVFTALDELTSTPPLTNVYIAGSTEANPYYLPETNTQDAVNITWRVVSTNPKDRESVFVILAGNRQNQAVVTLPTDTDIDVTLEVSAEKGGVIRSKQVTVTVRAKNLIQAEIELIPENDKRNVPTDIGTLFVTFSSTFDLVDSSKINIYKVQEGITTDVTSSIVKSVYKSVIEPNTLVIEIAEFESKTKYYVTIDKESIIYTDDTIVPFSGIHRYDWLFTTQLDITWSFDNSGHTQISFDYYKNIYGWAKAYKKYKRDDGTKGQCHGMVVSTININNSLPSVNTFYSSDGKFQRKTLSEVKKSDYNSILVNNMTAEDYIKYSHIIQYDDKLFEEHENSSLDKDKLQKLYKAVLDYQNGIGSAVIIGVHGVFNKNNVGHTLWGISVTDYDGYSIIDVYDCNFPNQIRELILYKKNKDDEFSSWSFFYFHIEWGTGKDNNNIHFSTSANEYYGIIRSKIKNQIGGVMNYEYNYIQTNPYTYAIDYKSTVNSGVSEYATVSLNNNSQIDDYLNSESKLLFTNLSDFKITNELGISVDVSNGNSPDFNKISGGNFSFGEVDWDNLLYYLKMGSNYIFSEIKKDAYICVVDNESGIEVNVPANSRVNIHVDDNSYNETVIDMPVYSNFSILHLFSQSTLNITGTSTNTVKSTKSENGIYFSGSDAITINVESGEYINEINLPDISDYVAIMINVTENNGKTGIVVAGDRNGNDIFNEIIFSTHEENIKYYTASLIVKKDGNRWYDYDKTFTLKLSTDENIIVPMSNKDGVLTATVKDGIWKVYDNDTDTGKEIIINGTSNDEVLNYYTVSYSVDNDGITDGIILSATYDGKIINNDTVVLGGKILIITVLGVGAFGYAYKWFGTGTNGQTTNSIIINELSSNVNAVCTVTEDDLEPEVTLISSTPSAKVEKLNGNQNRLFITIIENYSDGTIKKLEWNGLINNNSAETYKVDTYKVYVNTKGNTEIRECYIIK